MIVSDPGLELQERKNIDDKRNKIEFWFLIINSLYKNTTGCSNTIDQIVHLFSTQYEEEHSPHL